jgi:hypothetical protein
VLCFALASAGVSPTDVVNELVTDVSAIDKRVTAMETHATKPQHDTGLDQVILINYYKLASCGSEVTVGHLRMLLITL